MKRLRWWDRFSWQVSAALLLSMVSGFGFSENAWLGWLRWFGSVGEFLTKWLAGLHVPFLLAFLLGFVVNTAFWSVILVVAARLATLSRQKSAAT